MIFISAQPDTTYFIWQVELQLFNLLQKCWPADKIHVLFAYSEENGINPEALRLQDKFPDSPIYFYADTRLNKEYSVTVRPHILEKHLTCFPKLRTEALFHLDSDVIFREIPDFSILEFDDNWYASDTRSYMSCDLLIDYFGYDVFKNMCGIINVLPEEVIKYRSNTGGAQYIIKNTPVGFWSKVESDCNKLYDYLRCLNETENIQIEPSACASFQGPVELMKNEETKNYIDKKIGVNIENAYHICWSTGGSIVPKEDMDNFLKTHLK